MSPNDEAKLLEPGDDRLQAEADKLGKWLGQTGRTLVFGGTDCGIMAIVANATLDAGGQVFGVIPAAMHERGISYERASQLVITDDMISRKKAMLDKADAYVVLPGGVGTFDELTEIAALRYLGYLNEPILLVNVEGFYDELLAFWDKVVDMNLTRVPLRELTTVVADVDAVIEALT